jgi:hypothetical protein
MVSPRSARSGERAVNWLLLAVAVAAAVLFARRGLLRAPAESGRVDPVSAVPPGPELLITADVEALAEAAGPQLLRAGIGSFLGLSELCGFEPLLSMRRVAFAMPVGSQDFAFIAETTLAPEAVLRCAELMIRKRGGVAVRAQLGRFDSVRDRAKPVGEMAIRGDGLFVLSGGQYFRDVLDRAAGASRFDDAAQVRERLHGLVRGRLGQNQLTASSVSTTPDALLPDVRLIGAAIDVQRTTRIRAFVGCSNEAACADALAMVESLQSALKRDPLLAPLAATRVTQRGAELVAEGEMKSEQVGPMLAKLLAQ